MGLTPSQSAAVECDDNLVIFAGPGSGKTSTSVAKARKLLQREDTRVVLCTFSVEAARELDARLRRAFAASNNHFPEARCRVGTLDSFAYQHLRQCRAMRGKLQSPKLQGTTVRRLARELPTGANVDDVLQLFELMQCAMDAQMAAQAINDLNLRESALLLFERYTATLDSAGLVDLSAVKRQCATGLRDRSLPLFRTTAGDATHMIVDEEQDCDHIQLTIAMSHADRGCIVTLVGDDDQSIYGWRGATGYEGMTTFISHVQAQCIVLEENFRSHSEIVDRAALLIGHNDPLRVPKTQKAVKGPGAIIELFSCGSLEDEVDRVVDTILAQRDALGTVAILARRNGALDAMEAAIASAGYRSGGEDTIAYVRPGHSSLWDRDDVTAYVALLEYVTSGALDSLACVLNWLDFYSPVINGLLAALREHPGLVAESSAPSLDHATPSDKKRLDRLFRSVALQRINLSKREMAIALPFLGDEFRLLSYGMTGDEAPDSINQPLAKARSALAANAERVNNTLLRMPASMSLKKRLLRIEHARQRPDDRGPEVVRLLTMHGSKGLEFDSTFLINCMEGEDDSTMSFGPAERRVMYVAMTRARRRMQISYTGGLPLFLRQCGWTNAEVQDFDPEKSLAGPARAAAAKSIKHQAAAALLANDASADPQAGPEKQNPPASDAL